MQKILTMARRELSAYFFSPMAYVAAAAFLIIVNIVFLLPRLIGLDVEAVFRPGAASTLGPLFDVLAYALVIVMPLLTMQLLSEEFHSGTVETLMTAPVTDAQVVLGKFLGALLMYLVLLATTIVYFVLVAVFGKPDWGVVGMGYLGMILLGALYISVGLFASSLTRHLLVAVLVAIGILGLFTGGTYLLALLLPAERAAIVSKFSLIAYFGYFTRGVLDSRGVLFFLTSTAFFLFLSIKALESRRWR